MGNYEDMSSLKELIGKTVRSLTGCVAGSESMTFETEDGFRFTLYNSRDCCESVSIEDVAGDVYDLIGSPMLMAEEVSSEPDPDMSGREFQPESYTWSFYKFATMKGYVTIRWYGESNGYYGETATLNIERPGESK